MNSITDYHCHLLPEIDDGPSTLDESIKMATLLSTRGYKTVHCTPHMIKHRYDADNETVRYGIRKLQQVLDREGIPLKLLEGREYFLDDYFHEYLNDLMPLEQTSYLLIEMPPGTYSGMVRDMFAAILRRGLTPMIAHPERSPLFSKEPETPVLQKKKLFRRKKPDNDHLFQSPGRNTDLVEWLRQTRCAFQGDLGSFIGIYGDFAQKTAYNLKHRNIYTHYGTDAHSAHHLEYLFSQIEKHHDLPPHLSHTPRL